MNDATNVALAGALFVGTHFLLSHPLRAPLVSRIGEQAFFGLYSAVALATFGLQAWLYANAAPEPPLWQAGGALWALASLLTLAAAILFAGSLIGNPALPGPVTSIVPRPRGVLAITRHAMMWSFALWAVAHILVFPVPANLALSGTILFLALVGARLQDVKKARLRPEFWPRWESVTSYWPFAALRKGRAQWAAAWPGTGVTLAGLALWLAATWAHQPLAGMAAGVWRWLG